MTVEDPIEYTLDGINQVQVKDDIGLTFAAALRTFLRQDPDIIMLGEVRDNESAQMAIRAALTGHLVFSTVHTNSAFGTISRLLDMDIPPYLVSSTLNLSMAQRLVRLLCPHCKQEEEFSMSLLPANIRLDIKTHYQAIGCEHCYFTGYIGRKAIYELIPINHNLADKIKLNNLSVNDLRFQSLKDSALELFLKGQTSFDEILSYLL
jgi:type II secretory ATPase GspE/PulE/Tfp pilus assembly ATPase PilB-like protein